MCEARRARHGAILAEAALRRKFCSPLSMASKEQENAPPSTENVDPEESATAVSQTDKGEANAPPSNKQNAVLTEQVTMVAVDLDQEDTEPSGGAPDEPSSVEEATLSPRRKRPQVHYWRIPIHSGCNLVTEIALLSTGAPQDGPRGRDIPRRPKTRDLPQAHLPNQGPAPPRPLIN